ncbi:hypothetical protein SAY87_023849 [Trapa incisa]|uniref:MSP domain-containing protein n=1 Tax=Trapa incisa TaxID=236973 RepID=A0AAN7KT83_9MYRT|nr:hypothetical protein SAY87_023849 [Trapa incisa]
MGADLLAIRPRELKFVFELKKQSTCSIQLENKTQHYVAFKVKTTAPKKYSVRPNVGVIMPKSTSVFFVTMQAQLSVPPDMSCKDKFLIQSTVVPAGTVYEDITRDVFSKEECKFIEENKLRVFLVSPPESPINGAPKQGIIEAPNVNGANFIKPESTASALKVTKAIEPPKVVNDEESHKKDVNLKWDKEKGSVMKAAKVVQPYTNLCVKVDEERVRLLKDIKEIRAKLSELESKLGSVQVTISKLQEEEEKSRTDLQGMLRMKGVTKTVYNGFPLLFVVMVALLSLAFGKVSR